MPLFGKKGFRAGVEAEYEPAIRALFPYDDKFKRLQMLAETNARAQMPMTVLGTFRRKFGSIFLRTVQEEYNLNRVALDRKGRLELSEIVARPRKEEESKEF